MKASGDLVGAHIMYERALKIVEASFGSDHPQVASCLNNMAGVYYAQGNLVGARTMYERALVILYKFLPPDHPKIKLVQGNLDTLNDL